MKIVITGANGQLGTDVCRVLQDSEIVPLTDSDIDITSMDMVKEVLTKYQPDVHRILLSLA